MKPFLQPLECGRPVPDGWVVEPAGEWNGRQVEAAYDLRRHQVLLARSSTVDELEADLVAGGWQYDGTDGRTSMWVRDRPDVARTRLAQEPSVPASAPAPDLGGPGL